MASRGSTTWSMYWSRVLDGSCRNIGASSNWGPTSPKFTASWTAGVRLCAVRGAAVGGTASTVSLYIRAHHHLTGLQRRGPSTATAGATLVRREEPGTGSMSSPGPVHPAGKRRRSGETMKCHAAALDLPDGKEVDSSATGRRALHERSPAGAPLRPDRLPGHEEYVTTAVRPDRRLPSLGGNLMFLSRDEPPLAGRCREHAHPHRGMAPAQTARVTDRRRAVPRQGRG